MDWSISLSTVTSGMHLQTRACRTPVESGQEYLTSGKQYTEPHKIQQEIGTRRKNRSVSRTGPALGGWGN